MRFTTIDLVHGPGPVSRNGSIRGARGLIVGVSAILWSAPLDAQDCNDNGVDDAIDVASWVRFADPEEVVVPEEVNTRIVVLEAADLDGDGDQDMVAGTLNSLVFVFANDAVDGIRFDSAQDLRLWDAQSFQVSRLHVGDVDGDELPDLVLGCDGIGMQRVIVLRNEGGLGFGEPIQYGLPDRTRFDPQAIPVSDMDGDGDLDIAASRPTRGFISLFENDGAGSFSLVGETLVASSSSTLLWDDFDGDGDPDFLGLQGGPAVSSIARNLGDASLGIGGYSAPEFFVFHHDTSGFTPADLNGDGALDLAFADGASEICVSLNSGAGHFGPSRCHYFFQFVKVSRLGDIDGDGDVDIFTVTEPPGLEEQSFVMAHPLLNDGDGVFRRAVTFSIPETSLILLGDVSSSSSFDPDLAPGLDLIIPTWDHPPRFFVLRRAGSQTGSDCNQNGIPDSCDISSGILHDDDENGVPDECEAHFRRGDANADGELTIGDPIHILNVLFLGFGRLTCLDAANANGSAEIDLTDAVYLLGYLFLGDGGLQLPGPPPFPCGRVVPGQEGTLGCKQYGSCS